MNFCRWLLCEYRGDQNDGLSRYLRYGGDRRSQGAEDFVATINRILEQRGHPVYIDYGWLAFCLGAATNLQCIDGRFVLTVHTYFDRALPIDVTGMVNRARRAVNKALERER